MQWLSHMDIARNVTRQPRKSLSENTFRFPKIFLHLLSGSAAILISLPGFQSVAEAVISAQARR